MRRKVNNASSLFVALHACLCLYICSVGYIPTASAENTVDFYHNKQVRIIIGTAAGTAYDLYARTIARHIGNHIPGNPTFIPQNMEGAGGRVAANWLFNLAPRDGTVIGTVNQGTALDQARKQQGIQFDATKFGWIGNPIVDNLVTTTWIGSGLSTIEDIKRTGGLICGGTGASNPGILNATILGNLLNTKVRIIAGYGGDNAIRLAMERGEVNCNASNSWGSLRSEASAYLNAHKFNMIVQWGPVKNDDISSYQGRDVPLIDEFAHTEIDRKALDLVNSGVTFGRPLLVPPAIPQDRLDMLRRAFDATMADPEFIADASTQTMGVSPIPGKRLQQVAADVVGTSEEILARFNQLTAQSDLIGVSNTDK